MYYGQKYYYYYYVGIAVLILLLEILFTLSRYESECKLFISAELKASSEANRVRLREEAELEVGDLNIRAHIDKWVQSPEREEMRLSLKVTNFYFATTKVMRIIQRCCRKLLLRCDRTPTASGRQRKRHVPAADA